MKRHFLIILSTLFALAAISLVLLQVVQTKRSAEISDNLFNISVNNAMDNVFTQINQMRVEDYVNQKERFHLLRYRRIEELNDKMQDIVRNNSELFYDEQRVSFGVSSQDSAFARHGITLTDNEVGVLTQYNTLLNARNRLVTGSGLDDRSSRGGNPRQQIDASKFNFPLLDSLIREELVINGIDLHPTIGVLATSSDTLLYATLSADTDELRNSAYKFNFHANGIVSHDDLYVVLAFPPSPIILSSSANLFNLASIGMILLISLLFILSLRAFYSQRKLNEMKSDFINNMTHEIKTPLATISLACEMLSDNSVNSDADTRRNFVNIISDENRRMRIMTETMLQSAKMSRKGFSLNLQEIDLNTLVESSAQSFALTIENRHGTLDLDLQPIKGALFADELHISNMTHNLIDNAIKYSDGEPHISISTATEGNMAVLRVADQGIGIAKEDQKHIFEKFYRVSTGNVHNVKGFGIGLNYVYQVILLHKGKVSVASEPGHGSVFTISLPLS